MNLKRLKRSGKVLKGKVYKIKAGQENYVLKTIKNNIEVSILEIMILKNLKSPYIVNLYGFNLLPKKTALYLTLGQYNLTEAVEKSLLTEDLSVYMNQLLRGLDYL